VSIDISVKAIQRLRITSNTETHPKIPTTGAEVEAPKPQLLDAVPASIRRLNYSIRTEDTYVDWVQPRRLRGEGYGFRPDMQIPVHDGKGDKDRVTMLPQSLVEPLCEHLEKVRALHRQDMAESFGAVYPPYALDRK